MEPRLSELKEEVDLGDVLGRGRFAEVFKGNTKGNGLECAVKVLKKRGANKASIQREVAILKKLTGHSNVLEILDWFQTPKGDYVLLLELLKGGELFDYLIEKEYLSEKDAICYTTELLEGVQHLHQNSICHLDLKPENIVLVDAGNRKIKIVDFGCARDVSSEAQTQTLGGTAEFVAPEVINFDPVSTATDMWSIGVITYVMLSGLSPFLGDNDGETCANVTRGEYFYPDDDFPPVSEDAKRFIDDCLLSAPKKRLTADKALHHSWIHAHDKVEDNILTTSRLKQFRARRRFVAAVHTVRLSCAMVALVRSKSLTEEVSPSVSQ